MSFGSTFLTGLTGLTILLFFVPTPFVKADVPAATKTALKHFTHSCELSFKRSNGGEDTELSHQICKCSAQESQSQGVTLESLAKESELIEKNPKYEIQDEKLMNSLRYCALETLRKQSYAH